MRLFQNEQVNPEQSKSRISNDTVRLALENEAAIARREPGKDHFYIPPNWMRDECAFGAKNGIGAKLKLKHITVETDGRIRMVA